MSDNPNFNGISLKALPRLLRAIGKYRRERRGPMTSNFAECGGFLKTRPDLDIPDIQLHFGMALADDHGRKRHRGTGFTCHVCLLRPKSRGEVTIGSADPFAPPVIDPNFFGDPDDLETMMAGFKTTRRLMETPALRALQKKDMFTEACTATTISAGCCARASIPSIIRSAPHGWASTIPWRWSIQS
jgi:choline dehydrogenase-like flavoprotein